MSVQVDWHQSPSNALIHLSAHGSGENLSRQPWLHDEALCVSPDWYSAMQNVILSNMLLLESSLILVLVTNPLLASWVTLTQKFNPSSLVLDADVRGTLNFENAILVLYDQQSKTRSRVRHDTKRCAWEKRNGLNICKSCEKRGQRTKTSSLIFQSPDKNLE